MSAPATQNAADSTIVAAPAREYDFQAHVTGAAFGSNGIPVFALGDGTLRIAGGATPRVLDAHRGAILAFAAAPDGSLFSGGDDGVCRRIAVDGANEVLLETPGQWIENIAVSPDGSAVACSVGQDAVLIAAGGKRMASPRRFAHSSTATGLAFDMKGKRIAVAHYGGVSLWWRASDAQTPAFLAWRGSHLGVTYSPDGRFLVTTMQENSLHGWRLADNAHFQMNGFPAKIKSLSWGPRGHWLATSRSDRALVWQFTGKQGPIGRDAHEIGRAGAVLVTSVAAHPRRDLVAMGYADGAIALANALGQDCAVLRVRGNAAISALAWSEDGERLAAGGSDGFAAVLTFQKDAQ